MFDVIFLIIFGSEIIYFCKNEFLNDIPSLFIDIYRFTGIHNVQYLDMDQIKKNADDLEMKDTGLLAIQRTMLAQERTLMAWVRTSLSMISFGFTIFKLFGELKQSDVLPENRGNAPRNFGLILVGLGTFFLIAASIQNHFILKDLYTEGIKKRISLPVIAAIVISLLGVTMLFGIFFKIGPLS